MRGDRPALTDYSVLEGELGSQYTYRQMYEKICWLQDSFRELGLQKGDHIALCGSNTANWAIAYLAIELYQGVAVTIMHTLAPETTDQMIAFADSKYILCDQEIWDDIKSEPYSCSHGAMSLDDFSILNGNALSTKSADCSFRDWILPANAFDDLAHISYTSGSTDIPKAVMVSYHNASASVMTVANGFPQEDIIRTLCFLPLSHIYIIGRSLMATLTLGGHVFLYNGPFSLSWLCEAVEKIKPQDIGLVPMIVEGLLSDAHIDKVLSWKPFLQNLFIGGAVVSERVQNLLYQNKIPFSVGYGSTESTAMISTSYPNQIIVGSCGKIIPTLEGRIAPNGEILVRGENVMLGYYKDPEATAAKIDKDGWLHTGDRGHMDEDGYLYVEGRLEQDMIVLPSGENISPAKVEAIINACDGVEESIVIARNGKLLALVVMKDFSRFSERSGFREQSEQEFRNHLLAEINPQLPAYSQLFGLEFLSAPLARTEKKTIKRYLYK